MNRKVNEALAAKSNGKPELISAQAKELLNLRLPTAPGAQRSSVTFFGWLARHAS